MKLQSTLKAWVARDKDGSLFLFLSRPIKFVIIWMPVGSGCKFLQLDDELYPEVKWEDEEPTELTFTVKNK